MSCWGSLPELCSILGISAHLEMETRCRPSHMPMLLRWLTNHKKFNATVQTYPRRVTLSIDITHKTGKYLGLAAHADEVCSSAAAAPLANIGLPFVTVYIQLSCILTARHLLATNFQTAVWRVIHLPSHRCYSSSLLDQRPNDCRQSSPAKCCCTKVWCHNYQLCRLAARTNTVDLWLPSTGSTPVSRKGPDYLQKQHHFELMPRQDWWTTNPENPNIWLSSKTCGWFGNEDCKWFHQWSPILNHTISCQIWYWYRTLVRKLECIQEGYRCMTLTKSRAGGMKELFVGCPPDKGVVVYLQAVCIGHWFYSVVPKNMCQDPVMCW